MLCKIAHSIMVHARVSEAYIHFAFMYTTDHIFPVLPTKYLINDNGDPTTPYKLATGKKPSDRLFSIITLMNSGHTCIFQKRFCAVYFEAKNNNAVTLPHIAKRKHTFLGKIKEMSKKKKLPARKKNALELLHQILGHRSTISLLSGDTANVWEDIEVRIDPDPFGTSCQMFFNEQKG